MNARTNESMHLPGLYVPFRLVDRSHRCSRFGHMAAVYRNTNKMGCERTGTCAIMS